MAQTAQNAAKAEGAPLRVAFVGSGNWGSCMAKVAGAVCAQDDRFVTPMRMWVLEEQIEGRKLTDIINTEHVNVKYLPGVELPHNIVADADLVHTVEDADVVVFVLPHQFLKSTVAKLVGAIKPGAIAISLIKGMFFEKEGPLLFSQVISVRWSFVD